MRTVPKKNPASHETLGCASLEETHSARTWVTVTEVKGLHECHLETE